MSRKINQKISQRPVLIFERRPRTRLARLVRLSQHRQDKGSSLRIKTRGYLARRRFREIKGKGPDLTFRS